jgi:regulator of protease activity HflC (stomatin/prohibitin superfamily)
MSFVADLWNWLLNLLQVILSWVWEELLTYAQAHPLQTFIVVLAFIRLFGTTVQSGWKGVKFVFGRARQELEPGFYPLIPLVQTVRKTPVRSITLHLPRQRVTTADGLVYEVVANLVYRITDATKSMVQIDNVRKGLETQLTLIVQDLLRGQTRQALAERKTLEEEFAARAEAKLQRWGATVEQAGFTTIAPTVRTLRLTQLALLTAERERAVKRYLAEGLSPSLALALLGTDRHVVAHSTARYRKARRKHAAARRKLVASNRQQPTRAAKPPAAAAQSMVNGSTSTVNSTPEGTRAAGSTARST